ncbi:hypothetical protein BC826DRAFT_1109463 [Russula brevipes]|nr:hypothetical protein BC826DRAFT_1109463 [Russula brevipes]
MQLEALTEQDKTYDNSQSNDESEAEDSLTPKDTLTAERDEDLNKETSILRSPMYDEGAKWESLNYEAFDGSAAPSDTDNQDYGPDGGRYNEDSEEENPNRGEFDGYATQSNEDETEFLQAIQESEAVARPSPPRLRTWTGNLAEYVEIVQRVPPEPPPLKGHSTPLSDDALSPCREVHPHYEGDLECGTPDDMEWHIDKITAHDWDNNNQELVQQNPTALQTTSITRHAGRNPQRSPVQQSPYASSTQIRMPAWIVTVALVWPIAPSFVSAGGPHSWIAPPTHPFTSRTATNPWSSMLPLAMPVDASGNMPLNTPGDAPPTSSLTIDDPGDTPVEDVDNMPANAHGNAPVPPTPAVFAP